MPEETPFEGITELPGNLPEVAKLQDSRNDRVCGKERQLDLISYAIVWIKLKGCPGLSR